MKRRICGTLLAVAVVLASVNFPVAANAEDNSSDPGVAVTVTGGSEEDTEQKDGPQTIHVSAANSCGEDAVLRTYLENAEDASADTETEALDLEEATKDALTLADGTKTALDAQWVEKTDDGGNVTARYLEATLPAGAAADFDMQLMYRTDEENYTRTSLVKAKAFVDEQDVTRASEQEDEDNETEVVWELVQSDEVSEAGSAEIEESAVQTTEENIKETPVPVKNMAAKADASDLNQAYVYLDPKGMTMENLDWTNSRTTMFMIVDGWGAKQRATFDPNTGYWYWDTTGWTNTDKSFYFTIDTNNTGWEDQGNYRRTAELPVDLTNAKGRIFSWDGSSSASHGNYRIYELQEGIAFDPDDHTQFAGETMWFQDNSDEELSGITAVFYEKDGENFKEVRRTAMTPDGKGGFSVAIPTEPCSYVQFVDQNKKILGDTYSNFYGQGEEGEESFIFNTNSQYCYLYGGTAENSAWGFRSDGMTVYFDASLSELSYNGSTDNGDIGMPNSSGRLVCHAFTGEDYQDVEMTELGLSNGRSVYSASLGKKYENVIFYTGSTWPAEDSQLRTGTLTIDWSCDKPCFYADTSDDIAYRGSGKTRGGYWGELNSVRDSEKGKGTDVVDICTESFIKAADTMYLNSTFYDYYTDYELNGNNRDSYGYTNDVSQQNWVTFRQFNQALSEYYEVNNVKIPIYTGHFQPDWPDWGIRFSAIADTLGLYGYDKTSQNGFMSTNNSTMDLNGVGGTNEMYASAAQGLVGETLAEGTLTVRDGSAAEPHFDAEFLSGNNSKNTKLAEIYNNVAFPFTKKDIKGNGVEYWTFDSAETTLAMKQDPDTKQYYLKDVGHADWSKNVNSSSDTSGVSTTYGFFPFNETSAATSAKNYNYGFGTKIEFNFRLTDDGQVLDKDGQPVPITFEFSGDDDVWVFVDGNLALDVGGSHGRVTGSIDFSGEGTEKKASVSRTKVSQGSSQEGTDTPSTFNIKGKNGDIHTLTMYYMERGMWESNMKITFNFPDENLFEVEKQVDTADVNTEIFPEDLFTSSDSFGFHIKNAVTHWGEKAVSGEEIQSVEFNSNFNGTVQPSVSDNLFQHEDSKDGHEHVAHWWAKHDDDGKWTHKDQRWGIVSPQNGESVDISNQEYLSFDFYFDDNRIPSLNNMLICLEDSNGKTCDVQLSSQNVYGSASLPSRQWKTIRVYLDRIPGIEEIDKQHIAKVKLAFRYERDIYLDNIVFEPETTMDVMTGFTVQQADIPDYGSVQANNTAGGKASLVNPRGAVYTVTNENGGAATYGRIGSSGEFSLGDGDTASFSNQFRIGSYIYLEETGVNKDAFTTSWSLYDNGIPVTSYGSGETVTNPAETGGLVDQEGYALEDRRTENTDTNSPAANYDQQGDTSEPSIVFRSYTNPDSRAIATKLKAVVVNKVNTGSISITKGTAGNSPGLGNAEYTFKITFTNIAGSSLESEPIEYTVKVKAGETETITGIPIGTDYVIEEVTPEDGSRLESIILPEENDYVEIEDNKVHGLVMKDASGEDATTFVFKNTRRPLIDISVEKQWEDGSGEDISDSIDQAIYIQLQRKYTENNIEYPFEPVVINGQSYIEIQKGYEGWRYEFTGLEKYQDDECLIPYTYRVVEGTINENGEFRPVDDGKIIVVNGQEYVVDYQCRETGDGVTEQDPTDDIIGNDNKTQSQTFTETIVNKIHPKTDLKIVKVDASETDKKLGGVEFTLEKGTANSTAEAFAPDPSFGTDGSATMITGDGANGTILGEALISDLEEGIYRITETKAHAGYSLLKDPLYLTIDWTNGCKIQEGSSDPKDITVDSGTNTITVTVSNRLLFELPSTGGYLRAYMIVGGLALAGAALFIYRLQKRRKGARAPRR